MPRPKGSKNKVTRSKAPRKVTVANNDFEALIAEKTSAKENLTVEIASLEENLANIKADLKAKKAELKKLDAYPGLKKMYAADDGNTEVFYFKNGVATISAFTHEPKVIQF